jgi:hypothetical protein
VVTHTAKVDIVSGYTRATWAALCTEVGKLKVSVFDERLLVLATAERRYRNRWVNFVGVAGIEAVSTAPTAREDLPVTDGDPGSAPEAGGSSRTQAVPSLATALADAVLAGDHERARALAEELRTLPAARSLRSAR